MFTYIWWAKPGRHSGVTGEAVLVGYHLLSPGQEKGLHLLVNLWYLKSCSSFCLICFEQKWYIHHQAKHMIFPNKKKSSGGWRDVYYCKRWLLTVRALVALPEELASVARTHIRWLTTTYYCSSKESDTLLWLSWPLSKNDVIHGLRNTPTYI